MPLRAPTLDFMEEDSKESSQSSSMSSGSSMQEVQNGQAELGSEEKDGRDVGEVPVEYQVGTPLSPALGGWFRGAASLGTLAQAWGRQRCPKGIDSPEYG